MIAGFLLLLLGISVNIFMLSRSVKHFPRFAETCQGCGCQAPPMDYPPASYACPVCEWAESRDALIEGK